MKRKTKPLALYKTLLTLLMLTALSSCMSDVNYTAFRTIDSSKWGQTDTLTYQADTLKMSGMHGVQLLLHTEEYPYANIALNIVIKQDTTLLFDTVAIYDLTAETRTHSFGYRNDYTLSVGNITLCDTLPTTIQLTHQMTDSQLRGIREVGILIGAPIGLPKETVWRVEW